MRNLRLRYPRRRVIENEADEAMRRIRTEVGGLTAGFAQLSHAVLGAMVQLATAQAAALAFRRAWWQANHRSRRQVLRTARRRVGDAREFRVRALRRGGWCLVTVRARRSSLHNPAWFKRGNPEGTFLLARAKSWGHAERQVRSGFLATA